MKIIINAKANPELKEALRLVALDASKLKTVSSSAILVSILEADIRIASKLKQLKKIK
jgi:hypothetical protein